MKYLVWTLVVLLLIFHQDEWFFNFWRSPDLIFGFMPKTLLYHAGISAAAGLTWFLATLYAWPKPLQQAAPPAPKGNEQA
jgi:hypothetical protein